MADVVESMRPAEVQESSESPSSGSHMADSSRPKLPPCDQCRRRKVKCDGKPSCDRCGQSSLTCTREIQRKKRGPKKGSGSVIAKLRDEHEYGGIQEAGLPPFNLAQLDLQLPQLKRTLSDESALSSPLGSPLGAHSGETYGLVPDPAYVPRSVPSSAQDGMHAVPSDQATFLQPQWQGLQEQLWQYASATSGDGYVSVSDLAQQIFHDIALAPITPMATLPASQMPSRIATPNTIPTSIDALLNATVPVAPSPTTTATSSPPPLHGPKYLYRSDTSSVQAELRIIALAREIGMSAYLMTQCVKQFFQHLHPIMPVIHEATFRQRLTQPDDFSTDEKILVVSLCAITVLHCAPVSDLSLDAKKELGKQFLSQCLNYRRMSDWIETASLTTIITSYLVSVSYFELKFIKSHHFYLREAIGMAYEQGLHLSSTYAGMGELQAICSRRTFALLFVTERGCAILRNKPSSILKLQDLPRDYFDEHDKIVSAGFSALVDLFKLLDQRFVELWRSSSVAEEGQPAQLDNIASIQQNLNETSFENTQMTDIQKADVLITHQWLRLIFWQASMRQGLVSTSASDPMFWYDYPIKIAKDLCSVMHQLTFDAILVHGLGIFEKIFEVAYTLMDALTIMKVGWSDSQELRYLFSCLSASPNSHSTYVKMLENKMDAESLPMQRIHDNG